MVKLGGLWKNTDKNGRTYYRGKLGAYSAIIIFKNERKTKETEPDLTAYIAESEPKGERAQEARTEEKPTAADYKQDEIPF